MKKCLGLLMIFLLFTAILSSQTTTVAKSNKDLKLIKYTVEVTKPKAGTSYWEGSALHIRWRSKYTGAWKVSLVRDDKTKSKVLSGSTQHSGELHQMMVDIPKGLSAYPFRKFKVRVGTPSFMSKIVGWSKTFNIKALQSVLTSGGYPSEKKNCGIGKKVTYQWGGNFESSGTGSTYKNIPGTSRVGYENHYKEDGSQWFYIGYVYRAWIKFDLSNLVGKPGYVTKATLRILKHKHEAHPGLNGVAKSCCSRVYKLNAGYSGASCLSLPGEDIGTIPINDGKANWEVEIKTAVRNWITHPETNFGLLLIPFNENYEHTNQHCVTYYKTQLSVEYVESKK